MSICPVCRQEKTAEKLYDLPLFSVKKCQCKTAYIDPCLDAQGQMSIYQSSETLKKINPALESYYEYETLNPSSLTFKDYRLALQELGKAAGN